MEQLGFFDIVSTEEKYEDKKITTKKSTICENIQSESSLSNFKLIEPKKFKWVKFSSDEDRIFKLKNYSQLSKKNDFSYNGVKCLIVGYVDYPKNSDYNTIVLSIEGKLHCICTDYYNSIV